jgi:RNA polymerase sigma factor (TIGR02999 family)
MRGTAKPAEWRVATCGVHFKTGNALWGTTWGYTLRHTSRAVSGSLLFRHDPFARVLSSFGARFRFLIRRSMAGRRLKRVMDVMNVTSELPGGTADEGVVADALFGTLYAELHRLARREVNRRGPVGSLSATTLLHEAYLSMSGREGTMFIDHARFMGYAARVMRGLIIDDVRRRRSEKRGGLFDITSLGMDHSASVITPYSLVLISDALDELAEVEPALAEIIDLKFFCGFSFAEIAAMRGVSERTIQRNWEKGRLYLHHAIASAGPASVSANAAHQR